jgi:hypothetical protein
MFIFFSPVTFLLLFFYFAFFILLFCELNPIFYWFIIELTAIFFIGICYSIFLRGFSSLIIYFLVQSISSLILLTSLAVPVTFLTTLSFLIKTGIFPFIFWYISSVYYFNGFSLFLVLTFQKLPILFFFGYVSSSSFYLIFIMFSSLVRSVLTGLSIIRCCDFRMLVILGSFGGTSWFIFSLFVGFYLFSLFVGFYLFSLFFLFVWGFGRSSKIYFSSFSIFSILSVFSVRGFPPFPLFFIKFAVFYFYFVFSFDVFILFFLLISSVLTLVGYISFLLKYFVFSFDVFIF